MSQNSPNPNPGSGRVLLMSTGSGIGGEETFTTNLAESLSQRGWDVRVSATGPVHIEELKRRGLRVEELPIDGRSAWGLIRGARALGKYCRREGIRILHAQCAGPATMGIVARKLGMFSRPQPALIWHDHGINESSYRWVPRLFNRLDLCIAVSRRERDRLVAYGMQSDRAICIHNGIDLMRFDVPEAERRRRRHAIRRELGLNGQVPVVGYVGRLSPEKAPDDFLASFAVARQLVPGLRYVIVGDGPMRVQLEQMRRELRAEDQILMTGFRRDVPDILCAVDVLALVSHMETFGLAAVEAMALHVPCVATNVGGIPEQVVHGVTGQIVPDRSPEAIGGAIAEVLNDSEKRRTFGEAGYQRVRSYLNRDRMVDEIEQVYRRLLGGASDLQAP